MNNRQTAGCFIAFLYLILLTPKQAVCQRNADLEGIEIAIYDGGQYSGYGTPRESSMAALYWMFRWMNATVEIVNSSQIRAGLLNNFQMVVVPGGWAYDFYQDLGSNGLEAVQSFVSEGGSYWGSCAGAFLACEKIVWIENRRALPYSYGLALFPGVGVGPIAEIADWPNYVMTDIEINQTNGLVNVTSLPHTHSIMYYGGPYFDLDGTENVTVVAHYGQNREAAMIAFQYGKGRVFLSGAHPEWDEDSGRDGCTWENSLEDQESDWELCKAVSHWLVAIELQAPSPFGGYLIWAVILAGFIGLLSAIVLMKRRTHKSLSGTERKFMLIYSSN
ncbi:MAG: BPL-N domain-containing protein [Candidatus Thorarchaeota archaeon]